MSRIPGRVLVARILLAVCALGALAAAASDLSPVVTAPESETVVQAWRFIGLVTFAALFLLLARDPLRQRGLFVVVIANKLVLTLLGIGIAGRPEATDLVVFDGALTLILIAAFVVTLRRSGSRAGASSEPVGADAA